MLVLFLCCLCRYIHILAGLTPLPDGVFHREDVCADARLSLSCRSGQSMIVQEVQYGTKLRSVCSLSNRTSGCCRYDAADCFVPFDGNVVAVSCSGKILCDAGEIAATDSGSCGVPQYSPLSHYLTTVIKCVPDTRIGQSSSVSLADTGQLLYLQNTDYPSRVRSAEVSSSCSVETRSCSSKINVYFIHFELADGRGQCTDTQQIRIEDRDVTRTYTCSNNTNFVITFAFTSSSNYLNIEFKNPDGVYDGWFWVAFEETETTAVLTLDCPAVPQTICLDPVPVTAVDFSRPTGKDVTVTENIPVEIQCTTSPERPRSTIHWYISGNSVSLGTGTNTPTNIDTLTRTTSKLSVSFNRTSSGQELFCTAFNVDGQTPIESSRKNLVVEWGPEVDVLPDQIIIENQPLSVQCTANGNPQPTNFTWTRSQDNFQQKQSILQIKNTRREDTDIYTCTAKNNMLPTGGVQTPGVGTKRMNVEILFTDTSAKDSNTGAVVGGTIGGVLAITVIVVFGIIMLRRSTDFPGLKRHFNRCDDSNENTHVQETMTSSEASMLPQPQTSSSGSMHYECLVPNREPSAPYETLNTTTNNAALSDINILRSGDNPYVALDSSLDPTHTYTSLQGSCNRNNKVRTDDIVGVKQPDLKTKVIKKTAPEDTSSDMVVYSNLKLTEEQKA